MVYVFIDSILLYTIGITNLDLWDMQPEYQLMPKRSTKTDGSFNAMKKVNFFTNYYDIIIGKKNTKLYQYCFTLPEHIP